MAVEQHVFNMLEKVLGNLFVDFQLTRVDDSHVQPCFDRMVQKRGVDRFADGVVASEREADVGNAT